MTLFCLLAKHASHFAACSTNALIPRKVSHNDPTCHHSHWETAVVTTNHTLSCPAAGARSSAHRKLSAGSSCSLRRCIMNPQTHMQPQARERMACYFLTAGAARMQNMACCKTCLPIHPLLSALVVLQAVYAAVHTENCQQEAAAVCAAAT